MVSEIGGKAGMTQDDIDRMLTDSPSVARLALRVAEVSEHEGPAHEVAGW